MYKSKRKPHFVTYVFNGHSGNFPTGKSGHFPTGNPELQQSCASQAQVHVKIMRSRSKQLIHYDECPLDFSPSPTLPKYKKNIQSG